MQHLYSRLSNYKNRAIRVFTKDILPKNPGVEFDIFLCYDTDVFDFSAYPPVNWIEVEKSLKEAGAKRILHIKAKHSIEDWILNDIHGLCSYLRLPATTTLSGNEGIKKIENLFRRSNKVYVKGPKIKGFIDALDIQKIMCAACPQLNILCKELGIKCNKN